MAGTADERREMARKQATILFVEDELSLVDEFSKILQREGHRVIAHSRPSPVLQAIRTAKHIDLAVMDLQLPMKDCPEIGFQEAAGGKETGLVLARELRKKFQKVPIVFWTQDYGKKIFAKIKKLGNTFLVRKVSGPLPVLNIIENALSGFQSGDRPKIFIVHGHDEEAKESLRKFIQKKLKLPEPIVLREMPNHGRTVIEKYEEYAQEVDVVFVLLTPDDKFTETDSTQKDMYRSRQNVIFEMGYFFGALGRHSGRVILLSHGKVELPSDIKSLINIDITNGIQAAAEEIKRELAEWL